MSTERKRYRQKPVEAIQYDGTDESAAAIEAWTGGSVKRLDLGGDLLDLVTPEGGLSARPGDWIIRGADGEFRTCKRDVFAANYFADNFEPLAAPEQIEDGKPTKDERIRAAAPAMYEALEALKSVVQDILLPVAEESRRAVWPSEEFRIREAAKKTDAALALARGEGEEVGRG